MDAEGTGRIAFFTTDEESAAGVTLAMFDAKGQGKLGLEASTSGKAALYCFDPVAADLTRINIGFGRTALGGGAFFSLLDMENHPRVLASPISFDVLDAAGVSGIRVGEDSAKLPGVTITDDRRRPRVGVGIDKNNIPYIQKN